MSKPTHTVMCDFTGEFKVLPLDQVAFRTKGTSEVKANKIKEQLYA